MSPPTPEYAAPSAPYGQAGSPVSQTTECSALPPAHRRVSRPAISGFASSIHEFLEELCKLSRQDYAT